MFGRDEIAFAGGDDAEAVERLGGIRVAPQIMLEGFLRLTPRGDAHVGEAELVVRIGRGGAALDDLPKIGHGIGPLAAFELGQGEIVARGDVIRVKAHGVAKVSQPGVGVALLEAAHAEKVERDRVGLHGRQRAVEIGGGFVVLAVLVFGKTAGKIFPARGSCRRSRKPARRATQNRKTPSSSRNPSERDKRSCASYNHGQISQLK